MDKTIVNAIKANHAQAKQKVIERQLKKPIAKLIDDYIIEMDAKNMAYYFILQKGLLDDFAKYCAAQHEVERGIRKPN